MLFLVGRTVLKILLSSLKPTCFSWMKYSPVMGAPTELEAKCVDLRRTVITTLLTYYLKKGYN